MKSTNQHLILSVMLFASALLSFSQETTSVQPLVTDRPDATEASSTVGKGVLQFETGGLYESYKENNIKSENYTYNTMLVRYGILDNLYRKSDIVYSSIDEVIIAINSYRRGDLNNQGLGDWKDIIHEFDPYIDNKAVIRLREHIEKSFING